MVKWSEEEKAGTIQGEDNIDEDLASIENIYFQRILTDIEAHDEILKLLLSICKALTDDDTIDGDNHVMMTFKQLETAWHQVWLRALEWECLLEQSEKVNLQINIYSI